MKRKIQQFFVILDSWSYHRSISNRLLPQRNLELLVQKDPRWRETFSAKVASLHCHLQPGQRIFVGHTRFFTAQFFIIFFFRFDLKQSNFFNPNIRARIVQFILDRQRYSRDQTHDFSFGIDHLVNNETYIAAYPLHDGDITTKGSRRHLLYTKWASMKVSWWGGWTWWDSKCEISFRKLLTKHSKLKAGILFSLIIFKF